MALPWRLGKTALKWNRTVGKWPNTSHLIRLRANVVYSTEDLMHFLANSTLLLHIIPTLLQGNCFISWLKRWGLTLLCRLPGGCSKGELLITATDVDDF